MPIEIQTLITSSTTPPLNWRSKFVPLKIESVFLHGECPSKWYVKHKLHKVFFSFIEIYFFPRFQAFRVFQITSENPKTCLFDFHTNEDNVSAQRYLLEERFVHKRNKALANSCENGTRKERGILRRIIRYEDDFLLRERNSKWAQEMIRLLRDEPNSYFFAFGSAHFHGIHRVQNYLQEAGFIVEHLGVDDVLP